MNMKKNWLCLLSALLIVFSLAACGGDSSETSDKGKSDFESFMAVQKNMENIKDMEFKMSMDAEVPSDQGDYNMEMSGTGKEIKKSNTDIQMEMDYKMNAAGTDMSGTMYMKDQALYMEFMGQKVKMDASNEMNSLMNVDTEDMFAITEDMVSDLKVSEDGSDTVYKFTLDPSKALDYVSKNVAGAKGISEAQKNTTFDKMNVTVVADKNNMAKKMDMDFSMTTKANDETITMNYKMTMEYLSINTDLKIDFPDFKDYQEMTV